MKLVIPGMIGATANTYALADTEQKFPLGTRAFGWTDGMNTSDADMANFHGEFVYVKSGAAHEVGTLITMTALLVTAALANTANLGSPFGVAANRFTAADQFGWMQVSGIGPVLCGEAVDAADPLFVGGAGVAVDTAANGKQLCGMTVLVGSAGAYTKALCETTNGATVVKLPNTVGLYAGITVSGTGIAASTEISDIDVGGHTIVINNAATATGVVTLTFTHTLYGICAFNHPFAQGQVV